MNDVIFDPNLTKPDFLVLQSLAADIHQYPAQTGQTRREDPAKEDRNGQTPGKKDARAEGSSHDRDGSIITALEALNNPTDSHFEPTVFNGIDLHKIELPDILDKWLLRPYISVARRVVRVETDVVMLTHLLLYFSTSIPSAAFLFWRFSWLHGLLHFVMQVSYMGTYTLMMHQHIHGRGILSKKFAVFDTLFPYITDLLMGHTWNSYFYHHVKHHHIESNGPDDLSSTIRYQRDNVGHFLCYLGRFLFLVWLDLPLYFVRKQRPVLALKAAFWEFSSYAMLGFLSHLNPQAALFALLLPLLLLRLGLMVGNWGQHALVDHDEPDSDYRSSITLIDVPSNRHCFNDGYHTSHHLNPLRHWREHPVSFMRSKQVYASQHALVFHNIDYVMITIRLLLKDYQRLAECMVPIGTQISLSFDGKVALLKRHVQQFTEAEIREKFGKKRN